MRTKVKQAHAEERVPVFKRDNQTSAAAITYVNFHYFAGDVTFVSRI